MHNSVFLGRISAWPGPATLGARGTRDDIVNPYMLAYRLTTFTVQRMDDLNTEPHRHNAPLIGTFLGDMPPTQEV